MDTNIIVSYIMAWMPSIVAICGTIVSVVKIVKDFNNLRAEVKDKTEMNDIKNQIQVIIQENYNLKKQIKELIKQISKVDNSSEK